MWYGFLGRTSTSGVDDQSYEDPGTHPTHLGHLTRVYYFSVKPGMGNLLLNSNIATSAFICPVLVSKFLADNETSRGPWARWNVLKKLRVFIEYPRKRLDSKSDGDPGTDDHLNKVSARIKNIAGKSVQSLEDIYFNKRLQNDDGIFKRKEDGSFEFDSERTYVLNHLEQGNEKAMKVACLTW